MSVTTAQAVTLLENILFEAPSVAQANASQWVSQTATVATQAAAIAATPEAGIVEQVVRYYMGALNRVPSATEIQYFVAVAETGLTAAQLAEGTSAVPGSTWAQIAAYFAASPEFAQDYGLSSAGAVDASNEAAVISAFYLNVLGRAPSQAEIAFYENVLNTGTSLSTLVQYFATSPEYQSIVGSDIGDAIATYGVSAVAGTAVTTAPLAEEVVRESLGSQALSITGTSVSNTVTVTGLAAVAAQSAQTAATGVIAVAGVTATTGVQGVTAVKGVTPVVGQSAVAAVTDGAVAITDINYTSTGVGVITTVNLANSGAGSVIEDNGLTTLSLTGTTGTLTISNMNSAAISAHASTLALTLDGLTTSADTITDTNNEISTLNVTTATADSVLAGFTDTHLTTLNVAGTNKLTLEAINASLTNLNISGGASFSDGASVHGTGLSALGSALSITLSATGTGTFTAVLDDTTQSFTGGEGASVITVSSLADATKTITAGTAQAGNEIIFEGGPYALTSASSGKFVDFQTVGVTANVTGTIDLSVIDPTAKALEVIGADSGVSFTKAATGASLLLDPSTGATVSLSFADSTGAKDSATVTMFSAVTAISLQDSVGVGVNTVSIANALGAAETDISAAHVIGTLTDNGLAILNVTGTAGLIITTLTETSTPATSFTLNDGSTDGYGVTIGAFTDTVLNTLSFAGAGTSNIGALSTGVASLAVKNTGTALDTIDTITDGTLTALNLAANISLGQASTALITNGLQDGSTAGVTISGGSDNAHVTVNLTSGAATGNTDAITLGNGNNVVVDASPVGTVTIKLGSGANLVELGTASVDTTASYNVTFATRTATPPNAISVGAAGTKYASTPNLVVSGASVGDIVAFGNDAQSSSAALTATSLTSATTVGGAVALLEGAITSAHQVVYGVYGGNTYIVESTSGIVGANDTAVIEVTGSQVLTASAGCVALGTNAATNPFVGQAISETLGSQPVTVNGTSISNTVTVTGLAAAAAQSAQAAVTGVVGVAGVTAATGVQGVTPVTGVTPVVGRSAVTAVTDGPVTISDVNYTTSGAGVITTVILANSGAGSVIDDNGLTTLSLIGTTGTLGISNINSAAISAHASALALILDGLTTPANTITDASSEISTLNVTTAIADSTLAGFSDSALTALTVTGTNLLKLLTINSSLTSLTLSGGASFNDGATTHLGGLAALGAQLSISDSSSGSFTAVLDDTTQSFAGGSGTSVITVSSLADATKTINAGSAQSGNEIIFEGGVYGLTSASSGKFIDFQTVGVTANVTGTIDLSVIDPTAKALEVIGADSGVSFTKAATGASLLLDPSTGATVSLSYADNTGAKDSVTVTMSSAVTALSLQDSVGVGVGTVTIVNNLAATDTVISPAHVIGTLTDTGMSALTVSGNAGLGITALTETGASFTLTDASTDYYGVNLGTFTDTTLATLTFAGAGSTTIGTLTTGATALTLANSGTGLNYIDTMISSTLTSLTLGAGVALSQATTPVTTSGLQDSSTAGVTVSGGSDNAHVAVTLTNGAAAGKSDSITLGNGNDVLLDASTSGNVTVKLGSGANLVELGSGSLDTTAQYSVTFSPRTATALNVVYIGAAGTNYASAPNLVISGASGGDIIAFGSDPSSSSTTLATTVLNSAANVAGAIAILEGVANTAHKVAYGFYGGNTYLVESATGSVGATDTTVVKLTGLQALTGSVGYVTLGFTASPPPPQGSLLGAGFTIPAGTADPTLTLGAGGDVVDLTGPSAGVTDTVTSIPAAGALTINYLATSGTDTIQMAGSAGANASDLSSLAVIDASTGTAGVTIGAFTDSGVSNNGVVTGGLISLSYINSAVGGALMTQQTLTSNSLNTVNFAGGIASTADNYLFSGVLTTAGTLTINDSNVGSGTVTLGLVLNGGPGTLTFNMTGAGTLVTGTLPDNNLTTLNLTGTNGTIAAGTVIDTTTQAFTVNDTSTSAHPATMVLSGLSEAPTLTVNDSAGQNLTDNSAYSDTALTILNLNNTGAGLLTVGGNGLSISSPSGAAAPSQINITGSSTGAIATGTISDTGSGALTITDSYAATGTHAVASTATLPLNSTGTGFSVTSLVVNDSSSAALILGSLVDSDLTSLSLSNTGSAAMTFGGMTVDGLSTFNLTLGGTGSITLGTITDTVLGPVAVNVNSTSTAPTTLTFSSSIADPFNATSLTVDASTKGSLTLSALTDNNAANLTFSNNGTGLLTISGITDSQATLNVSIPDTSNNIASSSGPMAITLINGGSSALDISDSGTGAVALTLTASPSQVINIANSGPGGNNISLTDTTATVSLTLTGAGNQSITLSDNGGTITLGGSGTYSITLPTALHVIDLPTSSLADNANTTAVTADRFTNFHLDTGAAIGDTLSFGGAVTIMSASQINGGGAGPWAASAGMMTSTNATVLNFIAAVQAAGGSGIAGFYDGHNTWIAYNDSSGNDVAVIELVGLTNVAGLESGTTAANFVHIA